MYIEPVELVNHKYKNQGYRAVAFCIQILPTYSHAPEYLNGAVAEKSLTVNWRVFYYKKKEQIVDRDLVFVMNGTEYVWECINETDDYPLRCDDTTAVNQLGIPLLSTEDETAVRNPDGTHVGQFSYINYLLDETVKPNPVVQVDSRKMLHDDCQYQDVYLKRFITKPQ